jgi:uncharacterized glyoxalase superfamily protein PhnB
VDARSRPAPPRDAPGGGRGSGRRRRARSADIDAEYERLAKTGLEFTTPIETEEWGERFFQVTDPNGVVIQLVQWMSDPEGG